MLGISGAFFQASGKGIKDWELAVLSYMVRLGWDMELVVTLKLCGVLRHLCERCVYCKSMVCMASVSFHLTAPITFCATSQDWHWLRNHLFHNSSHKPLLNFLSYFLISFDGLLLAQHGVLMQDVTSRQSCKYTFHVSVILLLKSIWNVLHAAAFVGFLSWSWPGFSMLWHSEVAAF